MIEPLKCDPPLALPIMDLGNDPPEHVKSLRLHQRSVIVVDGVISYFPIIEFVMETNTPLGKAYNYQQ